MIYVLAFLLGLAMGIAVPRPVINQWRSAVSRSLASHVRQPSLSSLAFGLLIGYILIILSLLGLWVGLGRVSNDEAANAAQRDCQATYNQSLVTALHARSAPTRRAILAPHKFFVVLYPELKAAITAPPAGAQPYTKAQLAERHKLLEELVQANAAANKSYTAYLDSVKKHPLPELPNDVCGGDQ